MSDVHDSGPDPARARFFALGMIRLMGVALAFIGVAIIAKRLIEPAEIIGGVMLFLAAIDVMVVPIVLVSRWRTPKG
jgi:hypothetical protein